MKIKKIEKFLVLFAKSTIFISLITPLILAAIGVNLAEYPKSLFFKSVIELALLLYLFLVLIDKKYLPKRNLLLYSILAFDGLMIVSSLFGVNFGRSFWGDMQRGEGIILHLHLFAFFAIASGIFCGREEWINLFKASALVSFISAISGIMQQLGWASFYNVTVGRLSGTLSNPDLFGSFISVSVFISLFLWLAESNSKLKILWFFAAAMECYALFFSGTRSAWLGLFFGIAVWGIYFIFNLPKNKKIIVLSCLLAFLIFILVFFMNLQSFEEIIGKNMVQRFSDINISDRIRIWKIAIDAIKDRPIWGWGMDSFAFVSDKYTPGLSGGIYFDRPHNKVLEVLSNGGILGLLSYLSIFGSIFYLLFAKNKNWDNYNGHRKELYSLVFSGFFIAGFVQNIFGFDCTSTYVLFFLSAAFISNNFSETEERQSQPGNFSTFKVFFGTLFIFFMLWAFWVANLKPLIAGIKYPKSVIYETSNPEKAYDGYKNGMSMNTVYDNDFLVAYVERTLYLLETGSADNYKIKFINGLWEAKSKLYKAIQANDEQINHLYQYIARIIEQRYFIYKDPSDLAELEQVLNSAMQFNPNISTTCWLYGEMEIAKNNFEEGEKYIKKACDLDLDECAQDYIFFQRLAQSYIKFEFYELAALNYEKVLNLRNLKKSSFGQQEITMTINIIDYLEILYCAYLRNAQKCNSTYQQSLDTYPDYAPILKDHFKYVQQYAQPS